MQSRRANRGYWSAVLGCWCPRCREGKLFRHRITVRLKRNLAMVDECAVCKQPTDIEVGFYYGTGYLSYLLALLFTGLTCLAWLVLIGFSFKDSRFAVWMSLNSIALIAIQPWLMRFSRSLWLSFFVGYDSDWEHNPPLMPERVNDEQKNNW